MLSPAVALLSLILAAGPDDASTRFDDAEALYRQGRYEDAVEILEGLVSEFPDPILRFNLGRAYESAGLLPKAIEAYEDYLGLAPTAPDAQSVRDRITRLETRLRPDPVPESQPPPPPPPRPIIAPWVVAGVGGVVLLSGAIVGGSARRRRNQAEAEPIQRSAAEMFDSARGLALAANVTLAVGGAVVVAGVTWGAVVVSRRRKSKTAAVEPIVGGLRF